MTELDVREYEPRDSEAVWDLHERALREAGAFDPELTHLDTDLQRIESAYPDAGGTFLVGTLDGEVLAMGAARPLTAGPTHEDDLSLPHEAYVSDPPNTAVLKRMRVDPDHYREGFGSAILERLTSWARREGFDCLVLDTTPTQKRAMGFYESRGFEQVGRERTKHGTVLIYQKLL